MENTSLYISDAKKHTDENVMEYRNREKEGSIEAQKNAERNTEHYMHDILEPNTWENSLKNVDMNTADQKDNNQETIVEKSVSTNEETTKCNSAEENDLLSGYFEYIYTDILMFKRTDEEVQCIKDAVNEMVQLISDELGIIDSRFAISCIKFVGSMAEGTRNSEPDEFDFLLIIESISTSNCFELKHECDENKGHVHIVVRKNASHKFVENWTCLLDGKKCRADLFKSEFRTLLETTIKCLTEKNMKITKSSGDLSIYTSDISIHGPAYKCKFLWCPNAGKQGQDLRISVDLTAAINFTDISYLRNETDITNGIFFKQLQSTGKFMVVANGRQCSGGPCFRLTFTDTELQIMENMSHQHRKCYRILKYLFKGFDLILHDYLFHSYVLKTFILKHHNECTRNEDENGVFAACIYDILSSIQTSFFPYHIGDLDTCKHLHLSISVPSIFLPSQKVFDYTITREKYYTWLRRFEAFLKILEDITIYISVVPLKVDLFSFVNSNLRS